MDSYQSKNFSIINSGSVKRLSLIELQNHPWLLDAAAQNETPLQTPTTLMMSHTGEIF